MKEEVFDSYLCKIMTANTSYVHGEKGKDVFPVYYVQDNLIHAGHKKKLFLGDRNKKVCRFCHRDASATTFKQDAHLLPEFTGNKNLFSYFECDECNAFFSRYESAYANYFNVNHTFARLKGKKKIPDYNSKKEKFRVVADVEDLHMYSGVGNESVAIDEQAQLMSIKTIRPSYVPCDVFKCLVKIGLSAARETELHHFEMTRRWLMGEAETTHVDRPYSIIHYNIGGGLKASFPFAMIYTKKTGMPVPQSPVLIAYDHFKLQFFMPFDSRDHGLMNSLKVLLPVEGHLITQRDDGKGMGFYWKDLAGLEKVIGEEHTFSMGITGEQFVK